MLAEISLSGAEKYSMAISVERTLSIHRSLNKRIIDIRR